MQYQSIHRSVAQAFAAGLVLISLSMFEAWVFIIVMVVRQDVVNGAGNASQSAPGRWRFTGLPPGQARAPENARGARDWCRLQRGAELSFNDDGRNRHD